MRPARNQRRFDLSEWLIHFVRAVDLGSENVPPVPEEEDYGWGHIVEDDNLSPFFVLRVIVRSNAILPSWSVRRGRRTIYGPNPAICYTEMPIAAFIEAGTKRARTGENTSPYGLMFPKDQVFRIGGRPVIYGLSAHARTTEEPNGTRRVDPPLISDEELYRYVAFDATRGGRLDWTHEREWRVPVRECPADTEDYEGLRGHGVSLAQFTNLGAVVRSTAQADALVHDVVTQVDLGRVKTDTYRFVLVQDRLPGGGADIIDLDERDRAIKNARIDIKRILQMDETEQNELVRELRAIVKAVWEKAPGFEESAGEVGGCWLWLGDNTSRLARALQREGSVYVRADGRFLVELPTHPDYLSLSIRERMTTEVSDILRAKWGLASTYFSVLGSGDPEGVPFFNGDVPSEWFLNYAHRDEDY